MKQNFFTRLTKSILPPTLCNLTFLLLISSNYLLANTEEVTDKPTEELVISVEPTIDHQELQPNLAENILNITEKPTLSFEGENTELAATAALEKLQAKSSSKNDSKKEMQQKLHQSAMSYASNCHNHAADFNFGLSQGADPIVNLLKTAYENDLRIDSLYCSMRILNNTSKSCEYIRDCAMNNILEAINSYTKNYFKDLQEKNQRQKVYRELEKIIYTKTIDAGDLNIISPANFSSDLAKKVFKVASNKLKPSQIKEWQERLRALIFRHLETTISKTLWDIQDWPSIWESVLSSANALYKMSNILEESDHFDDLLWSLTHRFIWFLDFSAGQLPRIFYENLETSISEGSAFFLELPEQDAIRSKKQLLLQAIKSAKNKAFSHELFSNELPPANPELIAKTTKTSLIEPLASLFTDNPLPQSNKLLVERKVEAEPLKSLTLPMPAALTTT